MNQEFGLINLSLIPLRAKAEHASELTSQLLFGDCFEILDTTDDWVYIKTAHDTYEGWIHQKQFITTTSNTVNQLKKAPFILPPAIQHVATNLNTQEPLYLIAGSSLPHVASDGQFTIDSTNYKLQSTATKPSHNSFAQEILQVAKFYLNAPYLWGGRSVFGIDCSGFTQIVFKQFNLYLHRDAYQQAQQGELINFLEEAKTGDLAFFDNSDGHITHVGIIIDNNKIIHASGKVRIDFIDSQGIFNHELQRYTHTLRIIKRIALSL